MKKKKILITGGKGYLGGRLAEYLDQTNQFDITISSRDDKNLEGIKSMKVLKVDASKDQLVEILRDIDIIIHLAALDAKACEINPLNAIDVNIGDTVRWLEAASKTSVSQFIYFSTIHVYGASLKGIINEETLVKPKHPYAITHKCAEDYVLAYGEKMNFKSFVFRLSNAIGYPKGIMNQWNLLVPDLCKNAILKGKIQLLSNPNVARDFITIEDVNRAVEHVINNNAKIEQGVYNLSSGQCMTIYEMAKEIQLLCEPLLNEIPLIEFISQEKNIFDHFTISNSKITGFGFKFHNNHSSELTNMLKYCQINFSK